MIVKAVYYVLYEICLLGYNYKSTFKTNTHTPKPLEIFVRSIQAIVIVGSNLIASVGITSKFNKYHHTNMHHTNIHTKKGLVHVI